MKVLLEGGRSELTPKEKIKKMYDLCIEQAEYSERHNDANTAGFYYVMGTGIQMALLQL